MGTLASGSIDLKSLKKAGEGATLYITSIGNNGISVHPNNNLTNAVHITDQIDIIRNDESVMAIGERNIETGNDVVRIGKNEETRVEIDHHSMKLFDKEENVYFHVSDLRDGTGYAQITQNFKGDGENRYFVLYFEGATITNTEVYIDNVQISTDEYIINTSTIEFNTAPANNADIVVTYLTNSDKAKAYTLGSRRTGYATGPYSIAIGYDNVASEKYAVAIGYATFAENYSAHAEGQGTLASGQASHAEGIDTTASGSDSHAEGMSSEASGYVSHAEGYDTIASNAYSHAEGWNSTASGQYSHAEGYNVEARGNGSHAEGYGTYANGNYSHVQGYGTTATRRSQTAIGEYNSVDGTGATARGNYAVIVGNGTSNSARSNALTVAWNGNVVASGNITDGTGNVLSNKVNTSSLATVATTGAYSDLSGKPNLATVATSGAYNDLSGKPNLATVATSGDYDDLTDKPQINGTTLSGNKTFANLGLIDFFYPKGSYYETNLSPNIPSGETTPTSADLAALGDTWFNPNYAWGGTWVMDSAGRITVAYDSTQSEFDTIGETGGSKYIQAHSHSFSQPTITSYYRSTAGYSSGSAARPYTSSGSSDTTDWAKATGGAVGGVQSTTHGALSTGDAGNMPPYIVVYRWHRTA